MRLKPSSRITGLQAVEVQLTLDRQRCSDYATTG
jgi:hypothetical protein